MTLTTSPAPLRSLALAASLCACGVGPSSSTDDSTGSTDATATTDATTSDTAATSDETTAGTSDATSDPSTDPSTDPSGTETTAETETETGGEEYCELGTTGGSSGAETPWIEVTNEGAPLMDGQTLRLQCGFQGFFMFEVHPYVGGFEPDMEYSDLEVALDIEGYNNDPDGHFWSRDSYGTFIGCEDPDYSYSGSYTYTVQMIPDDELPDKTVLDGLPAHLEITLHTPDDQSASISAELVVQAVDDGSWEFCLGY
ncbi:MAG: hypothetical protein R3A51_05645 [Nannocystaceae bacterium]|nr:hypothetical protein [Myxococcales bacterium]